MSLRWDLMVLGLRNCQVAVVKASVGAAAEPRVMVVGLD
jgi:hypothetical protein